MQRLISKKAYSIYFIIIIVVIITGMKKKRKFRIIIYNSNEIRRGKFLFSKFMRRQTKRKNKKKERKKDTDASKKGHAENAVINWAIFVRRRGRLVDNHAVDAWILHAIDVVTHCN